MVCSKRFEWRSTHSGFPRGHQTQQRMKVVTEGIRHAHFRERYKIVVPLRNTSFGWVQWQWDDDKQCRWASELLPFINTKTFNMVPSRWSMRQVQFPCVSKSVFLRWVSWIKWENKIGKEEFTSPDVFHFGNHGEAVGSRFVFLPETSTRNGYWQLGNGKAAKKGWYAKKIYTWFKKAKPRSG